MRDDDTDFGLKSEDIVAKAFDGADEFHDQTGQSGVMLDKPPSLEDLEWLSGVAELTGPQ